MDEQKGSFSIGILHPGRPLCCRYISKLKRLVEVTSLQQLSSLLLQGYRF